MQTERFRRACTLLPIECHPRRPPQAAPDGKSTITKDRKEPVMSHSVPDRASTSSRTSARLEAQTPQPPDPPVTPPDQPPPPMPPDTNPDPTREPPEPPSQPIGDPPPGPGDMPHVY
jgi:hypothetical protein